MSPPLFILVGPTGAGKTRASLLLAKRLDGEIVNCDSRQIYADFPIVSAQPSPEEQAKAPHHLFGFLESDNPMAAGVFAGLAEARIDEIAARGKTPILVGGTGLYVKALLSGLAAIPNPDPEIRAALSRRAQEEGLDSLYAELAAIDPTYAEKIHPNDTQRVLRALEVFACTGKPFSAWHGQPARRKGRKALQIGLTLPPVELKPQLAARIDAMLAAGAVDEVRRAFAKTPDPNAPAFSGIGCAELLRVVTGELPLESAKSLWFKRTKDYAKRQVTWFKKDQTVHWYRADDDAGVTALAQRFFDKPWSESGSE